MGLESIDFPFGGKKAYFQRSNCEFQGVNGTLFGLPDVGYMQIFPKLTPILSIDLGRLPSSYQRTIHKESSFVLSSTPSKNGIVNLVSKKILHSSSTLPVNLLSISKSPRCFILESQSHLLTTQIWVLHKAYVSPMPLDFLSGNWVSLRGWNKNHHCFLVRPPF